MASISNIQENISTLIRMVEQYSSQFRENQSDFSLKLTIENIKSQIEELQKFLYLENIKREKEIVKLRFMGQSAKHGTFPLELVGGITNSFSKAILNSSKFFQFGNKGGTKIDKIIGETVDLRLEGLGKGSTIFYLSANTSPDLFGNSIIQNSFENTFDLFNSSNQEEAIENITKVGTKSIKYYSSFFKELANDNLEIEMTWHMPNETTMFWEGKKDKILSLYNSLNSIQFLEPEEISFEGEFITLSLKGKFEVITNDNERIYGTFPNSLLEEIKQLHLGAICTGKILKTTIINPATGKEKYEFVLNELNS